jgi:hypothetical protein
VLDLLIPRDVLWIGIGMRPELAAPRLVASRIIGYARAEILLSFDDLEPIERTTPGNSTQ